MLQVEADELVFHMADCVMDIPTRMHEHLSALADGELADSERELALAALATPAGQRRWQAYHVTRAALRAEAVPEPAATELSARLAARLALEPAYSRQGCAANAEADASASCSAAPTLS